MTNAEIIATIRAEIERRLRREREVKDRYDSNTSSFVEGSIDALDGLLSFLSGLEKSEKPTCPEEAMKELDKKIALVKQRGTWDGVDVDKYMDELRGREESEKPINPTDLEREAVSYCFDNGLNLSPRTATDFATYFYELGTHGRMEVCEDLEQEIQSFWNRASGFQPKFVTLEVKENGFAVIARHFAQWGEHHAKEKMRNARRTKEAYQEVAKDMRKQIDGSLEIPKDARIAAEQFYPQDCFDSQAVRELGINCFVDGAKWGAEHQSGSSEIPKDLEEAAKEYSKERAEGHILYDWVHAFKAGANWQIDRHIKNNLKSPHSMAKKDLEDAAKEYFENPNNSWVIQDVFIAGAKWQKEQDDKELSDLLTIAHLQGAEQMKEQMMEDAIPCKVFWHDGPLLDYTQEQQDNALDRIGANVGDKVKVIIVKEDKK